MKVCDIYKCLKYFEKNIDSLEPYRVVCENKLIRIIANHLSAIDNSGITVVQFWMDGTEFYMMKNSNGDCVKLPFGDYLDPDEDNGVLLNRASVVKRYGVSNNTLSKWRKHDPTFPDPVKFNDKELFWRLEDLRVWEGCQ